MNDKTRATKNIETAEAMDNKARAIRHIETAEAMYDSSYVLNETYKKKLGGKNKIPGRAGSFFITANVLAAFGIENVLKALLRRQGIKPKKTHNLQKLYKELDCRTKKRLRKRGASIGILVEGLWRNIKRPLRSGAIGTRQKEVGCHHSLAYYQLLSGSFLRHTAKCMEKPSREKKNRE